MPTVASLYKAGLRAGRALKAPLFYFLEGFLLFLLLPLLVAFLLSMLFAVSETSRQLRSFPAFPCFTVQPRWFAVSGCSRSSLA